MPRLLSVSLFLFSALIVSCGDDIGPPPDYDFAPFDAEVNAVLQELEISGARAVVVHRDYGVLHMAAYGDHAIDRVSLLASSSKIISVGVLMRLHDQGVLDIDTPIGEYVPEFWGTRAQDITVAQMLSNSSGMVGLVDDPTYTPYLCQYSPIGGLAGCGALIYSADDEDDVVPPDTQFRYGGGQWQVAGALAVQVSGQSWDELLEETYREPCGLEVLGYGNHFQDNFTMGSDIFGYPSFVNGSADDIGETANPNIEGGGFTTIADYGEILLMHLRDGRCREGRVLSASSARRMREDRIAAEYDGATFVEGMSGYGMGWWLDRSEPGVVSDLGAYGAAPWLDLGRGYGAMLIIEDEAGSGGVAMARLRPILNTIFDDT